MKTPNEQITNGQVLKFFKEYWFVVVIIFSIAITWANFTRDISENTSTLGVHAEEIKSNTASLIEAELQYVEDITWIRANLKPLLDKK